MFIYNVIIELVVHEFEPKSYTIFPGTPYSWLWVLKKSSLSQWTRVLNFVSLSSLHGSK